MAKIFLNAGHGGSDSGAVGFLVEKDLNLKMALACRDYLIARGQEVMMGRETDVDRTSRQIIAMCNDFKPDYAIDIHNNAGKGDGFECYVGISGLCNELASNIEKEVKSIGQNSRGIKTRKGSTGRDYYYFIRELSCPSMICEGLFVDNAEDVKIADTDSECKIFGEAYARGILKTLGVSDNSISESRPAVTPTTVVQDGKDIYVVKAGDTLSEIAKANNTTVSVLQELNSIDNPNYITIGQKIALPTESKALPDTSKKNTDEMFLSDYRDGRQFTVNSNNGLNLRSGYGTQYARICTLSNSTKVMWYGYYKVIDGVVWRKIAVASGSYKGKVGYVSSQYLN